MSRRIPLKPPAVCSKFEVTPEDVVRTPRDRLTWMLFLLFAIREFETRVLALKDADLVHGPAHSSIGQEAVAAGVSVALSRQDMVGSTHRAHGHFLGKALVYYAPDDFHLLHDPLTPAMEEAIYRTLAEIMGLKDGWCGGRGGSMHLCDPTSGNLGSNGIVGGGIPLATGVAWAERLRGGDRVVVSFFGDGAINQGCFHEVANMAALWHVPVLYLVENNLYAVGTPTSESSFVSTLAQRALGYGINSLVVDGMDPLAVYLAVQESVSWMRERAFPGLIEARTYRYRHHGGSLLGSAYGYRDKEEEARYLELDPLRVYPRLLIAHGVIDEEQVAKLEQKAKEAVARAESRCTREVEGRKVIPAALWPDPATVVRDVRYEGDVFKGVVFVEREDLSPTQPMTYGEAIAAVTRRAMERDERVIVLGEEVANLRGGAYGATRGIKEVFPDRLINTPISETGFVGMAGGASMAGMRPIVEIMFPNFALMASDQLFDQIGQLRHMYGGQVTFPIIVRTRIATGYGYGGQHSMEPAGFFAQFPGWRVMAPSNAFDYIGMFNTALRFQDPVLIMEHGLLYDQRDLVPEGDLDYCVAYGRAKVVRRGSDVTVLTYHLGVGQAVEAAERLAKEGLHAEVIDLRTLDYQGLDWDTIGESVRKTGSVVVVERAPRSMAIASRLADEIQMRYFDWLDTPTTHVTAPDVPLPVSRVLEQAVLPDTEKVFSAIRRAAQREV